MKIRAETKGVAADKYLTPPEQVVVLVWFFRRMFILFDDNLTCFVLWFSLQKKHIVEHMFNRIPPQDFMLMTYDPLIEGIKNYADTAIQYGFSLLFITGEYLVFVNASRLYCNSVSCGFVGKYLCSLIEHTNRFNSKTRLISFYVSPLRSPPLRLVLLPGVELRQGQVQHMEAGHGECLFIEF